MCGRELEIAADIPVRSGDDVICSEDLRDSFPVFLRMVESIKEEIDFNNAVSNVNSENYNEY